MKMIKAALATITGVACIVNLCSSAFCDFEAVAKVIEPEVVWSESWVTSYFIDDDIETLYPYIDCRADIYNDGTLKLYMWNTHEWDGFTTVKHDVCFYNSNPISSDSLVYNLVMKGTAENNYYSYRIDSDNCNTDILQERVSYYPDTYSNNGPTSVIWPEGSNTLNGINIPLLRKWNTSDKWEKCFNNPEYPLYSVIWTNVALPNVSFTENTNDYVFCFSPTSKTKINENQYFRLFGRDITITPELLSKSIIATPQLTEQEKYIQELEAENIKLKSMVDVDSVMRFDTDGNGILDAKDASTILVIYAINSTGGNIKTLTELKEYYAQKK